MLLERSEVSIKAGLEDDFAAVMRERGLDLLTSVPGVRWAKLGRGVESPSKFMFLVEWDSLDAHAAFHQHPVHPEFVKLFAPYAETGMMEHFEFESALG
jgi:heme-degrading monooxygenase HmoA